ncbi:protocadherin beta-1-like [Paramacrobiotus metropolitanus]|uniref:protocadherin beta-1-like n=1 Tax=Paramacrobiotus metropolitanus TaxID=2943436 RepID=UPI0024460940|nr:protocadherin beta-1-like [Paramacrobiotus metropolitanus]
MRPLVLCGLYVLSYINALFSWTAAGEKIYPVIEELPVGTFVADVREQLPRNLSSKPDLKFGFLRGYDKKGFFQINDTSGHISTAMKLDRETLCADQHEPANCYFDIPVITLPLHQFQIIPIKVELLDINDNAPVFPQREIVLEISENQPVGAKFQIPPATDADGGKAAQIEYSLKSPSADIPFVIINSVNTETQDVYLQLSAPLDREVKDFYAFSVLAKDQGVPALVGSMDVVIQVTDANDHAPVFDDPSYEKRVPENVPRGTRILKVHASDADLGRNGEITYSIAPITSKLVRDIFDIDGETGEVRLKAELDREVKDVHKIWISARDRADSNPLDASVLATVIVDDLNDNPPLIDVSYFPPEASAAFISEDAPIGTFVALVRVKDADAGVNGRAVCSLQSDTFVLQQQSDDTYAIITSKMLDREKREDYLLELTARDQGKPSLESRTTLQILVGDVNDSPPVFDRSTYLIKVRESAKIGTEIVSLRVQDRDSSPDNQQVRYRLLEPSSLFSIDDKRGVISLQSTLDRETLGDMIQLAVEAFDPEKPAFRSQAAVVVEVLDENDNAPEWSTAVYEFDIHNDLRRGTVLGSVHASDSDFGNNAIITYYINSSEITINQTSGELVAARDIFVTEPRQIQLTLLAADGGEPRRTATAQVFITIANVSANQLATSQNILTTFFASDVGLPVIVALIVMGLALFVGAICFVVLYRNKSKENHSYNVRMETARVFQRGSKSQLALGEGSGLQSDTDSCHRRSVESSSCSAGGTGGVDDKAGYDWVFPNSQTPPVSSSTKSSRCSSASTNRNSLLNDYGKVVNGPIIYDVVNEETTSPPGKTIQTFQLANQLQKTLDQDVDNSGEEDDDGGFKRPSVIRASSFYQAARHPLTLSTARCASSINGTCSTPANFQRVNSLPRRVSLNKRGSLPPPPAESGYSSNSSFIIRANPIAYPTSPHREPVTSLSPMTRNYIDALQVGRIYALTPVPGGGAGAQPVYAASQSQPSSQDQDQISSPFSSSLNMSATSGKSTLSSSIGAGLEFDDFLPSPPIGLLPIPPTPPQFGVSQVVEYQSLC